MKNRAKESKWKFKIENYWWKGMESFELFTIRVNIKYGYFFVVICNFAFGFEDEEDEYYL